MKKKTIIIIISALLVLLAGVLLLVSIPRYKTIAVEDHINVSFQGYNGYGTAYLTGEYDWIDEMLPASASQMQQFSARLQFQDAVEITLSKTEKLSNGDKVLVTIKANNERLKNYGYKVKEKTITYTVSGLKEVVECDPFENLSLVYDGISGGASLDEYDSRTSGTAGGTELEFRLNANGASNLANGDTLHLTLKNLDSAEYYASQRGIVLTRTEMDVTVENLDYIPRENPKEIFQFITDESYENIVKALEYHYEDYVGEMSYTYVGAVYYYDDGEINSNLSSWEDKNLLGLIYHLDNGIYPGGWYVSVALDETAIVHHVKQNDGSILKATTFLGCYSSSYGALYDDIYCYYTESHDFDNHCLEYEELYYAGHQTLEECLQYIDTEINANSDHLVVTDSLASYVDEY